MGTICEHEFEGENPKNPGYSMTEYDLYARLGMTIRKNLRLNVYEIINIETKEVLYSFKDISRVVEKANQLEGVDNTKVKCGVGCPKNGRN